VHARILHQLRDSNMTQQEALSKVVTPHACPTYLVKHWRQK